ncbi:MAG TPA: DUF2382 domain-containing protein [Nitrolancea sp.]|nr:DUF2382 domain-containing protein [Nitrolancea sp.]
MIWNEPAQAERRVWEIDDGWDVVASDGARLGEVADVRGSYIVVEKGLLFKTDLYIPVAAIVAVAQRRVHLGLSGEAIAQQGWDQPPTKVARAPTRRLPRLEEPAAPPAEPLLLVQPGAPEAELPVDAPLRLEEIRVERRTVDPPVAAEGLVAPFQELEIVIPIRGEEAVVVTRPVVREEVVIRRGARERTELSDLSAESPGLAWK